MDESTRNLVIDIPRADSAEENPYPEAQFLAELKSASEPLKRLSDEAVAEHKAMKAQLKAARPRFVGRSTSP